MTRGWRLWIALIAAGMTAACSATAPMTAPVTTPAPSSVPSVGPGPEASRSAAGDRLVREWTSAHHADHPLVGSVWTADGAPSDFRALVHAVQGAGMVVLGETHTNPDHHALQAEILDRIAQSGARPAVVFEMIPRTMQGDIEAYMAREDASPAGFGPAVGWEARGWPAWSIYRPIAEVVFRRGLSVYGGNMPRDELMRRARGGADALGAQERAALGLDRPLPEAEEEDLRDVLYASHCEMIPRERLGGLVLAQRLRDGTMAAAMAAVPESAAPPVLIAGNGHARTDWGVPQVLERLAPQAKTVSVGIIEVLEGKPAPSDYDWLQGGAAPFDYILFTPRFDVSDPCEKMRTMMEGRKK